jgi:cytochrome c6
MELAFWVLFYYSKTKHKTKQNTALGRTPAAMRVFSAVASAVTAVLLCSSTPLLGAAASVGPNIENGAKVFSNVCTACHLGGYNAFQPARSLQADVLRANGMLAAEAIEYQVVHGKNIMPAFAGKLTDSDITDAAAYVVYQSEKGWTKPLYSRYPSRYVPR